MKKAIKITGFILLILLILCLGVIILTSIVVKDEKIDLSKLVSNRNEIKVYSYQGNVISENSTSDGGKYIKAHQLKDYTKNAFVAIEDKRFYNHNGVDYKRIVGATLKNIKNGFFKEGASTITQQLVKNTHLSNEKTVNRKLKEIKLAIELEKLYSKEKILECYLNTIYFGNGAYGIEQASKTYFNKSASQLSLNESAMLAGMIKAPSKYSLTNNYQSAIERKNLVLNEMYNQNYITKSQLIVSSNEKISFIKQEKNVYDDYVNAVLSQLESIENFSPYFNKTIKIYTYLDENLQAEISTATLEEYDVNKIVINSKINGVSAYCGENYNLKRCPASCVKPWLVYAPMIDDGYIKESSVISDSEIYFGDYSPKNYDGKTQGNVTVKDALKKSLNIPAVKLLNGYTIKKANNYTKKLGVDIENENLSVALGSINNGMSLFDLCNVYSVFNNEGIYKNSSFINKVYIDNVKIYEFKPDTNKVFSSETAFIINDVLKSAVKDGSSKKLNFLPYELCAKTGTNGVKNGNYDAYSIAYTTEHIVGVWVGNYDNEIMPNTVTGGNHPTIISSKILSSIYKNYNPKPFNIPSNVIAKQIDKNTLLNEQREYIVDEGEKFYYIKGSEPTLYLKDLKPEIYNQKITLNKSLAVIDFEFKNAKNLKIFKTYLNKTELVYDGKPMSKFIDRLSDFGVYNYKIELYNNEEMIDYTFSPLKFSENSLPILNNDNWLYD